MSGRNLGPASQTSHLRACKRLAAWLGRSPETATPDDVKYFQQHLIESGASIGTRNQTMTGQFLVGFIQTASVRILPNFLENTRSAAAKATFQFSAGLSETLTEHVAEGRLDAAVVTQVD